MAIGAATFEGACELESCNTGVNALPSMTRDISRLKLEYKAHIEASESYGISLLARPPENSVGISIGYCYAVRIPTYYIAISAEGTRRPPFSTVSATTTLNEREKLSKGAPVRTLNFCSVSSAGTRGAHSKWSAKSVSRTLSAAGQLPPEVKYSCNCANKSSTGRYKS